MLGALVNSAARGDWWKQPAPEEQHNSSLSLTIVNNISDALEFESLAGEHPHAKHHIAAGENSTVVFAGLQSIRPTGAVGFSILGNLSQSVSMFDMAFAPTIATMNASHKDTRRALAPFLLPTFRFAHRGLDGVRRRQLSKVAKCEVAGREGACTVIVSKADHISCPAGYSNDEMDSTWCVASNAAAVPERPPARPATANDGATSHGPLRAFGKSGAPHHSSLQPDSARKWLLTDDAMSIGSKS